LTDRARGKQTKAPNRVLIAFWNVLRPTINELFRRALHVYPATQFLVFGPKRDASFLDKGDAMLGNGWAPYIATGISQEMFFRFEGLDLNAPPTCLPIGKQRFHFLNADLCMKQ
jgi:hypothetical protein